MGCRPTEIADLAVLIADAATSGVRLQLCGGGSKATMGAPCDAELVDMRGFSGIVDYDPRELVLTVRAGTSLEDVQRLIAAERQMLAFEPIDHGRLLGAGSGAATIGGVIVAGVAGPQRLTMGAARDHLLGFTAVSGRGEAFVAGAKVVKNVTGFDLPKLIAGSWGRLAAVTELTLRVVPRPRQVSTMGIVGLDGAKAQAAMACAMGSHVEISAAAHLPQGPEGRPLTLFQLQGFPGSVTARCGQMPEVLREHGRARLLPEADSRALWASIRDVTPLDEMPLLWRISLPSSESPRIVAKFSAKGARWLLDWAGGLVWLAWDGDPNAVRRAAGAVGGHATLVRAPEGVRKTIPMQHPRTAGVAALEERVRRAFDPAGVFEAGRFLDATNAN